MIRIPLVVPRYPHPNTENEQWMTWIDRNISQSSQGFETVGGFLQGKHLFNNNQSIYDIR